VHEDPPQRFDLGAYCSAIEQKDLARWIEFYADGAEWYEYRERNPPRAPNVMVGKAAIRAFLEGVAASPLDLKVSHVVAAASRAAYHLTATLGNGDRIVENVILDLEDGLIVSQVDVEASD
jgi:hypothetical protein